MKILLLFVTILAATQAYDYCARNLCPPGTTHIACNRDLKIGSACNGHGQLLNSTSYIKIILKAHNRKRDQLASGNLSNYKPAARMATMRWDNELANIATHNIIRCILEHDKCHNTYNFKYSGQNLGSYGFIGDKYKVTESFFIKSRIDEWWSEYKDCNMTYIKKYPRTYSGPDIGHFTVLASEANTHVGCAIMRWDDSQLHRFLISCNYAMANLYDEPVYETGPPGSGCKSGKNRIYTNLCSTKEVYNMS